MLIGWLIEGIIAANARAKQKHGNTTNKEVLIILAVAFTVIWVLTC